MKYFTHVITLINHRSSVKTTGILISILLFAVLRLNSTAQTIGLLQHDPGSYDAGYVLFSPIPSTNTYLIDKCGKLVHSWSSTYQPGQSVYLLADGNLLRTGIVNNPVFTAGGAGGIIEKFDWNGNILWSYQVSDNLKCQHHDIAPMPNGNVLVIAWQKKSAAQAIAAGRNPSYLLGSLWSEQILELQPHGADSAIVVWKWQLWDHIVQDFDNTKANYGQISSNPQLMNINFPANNNKVDWIHMNAIDYNPALDQVMLSSHNTDEIWIIDHSTTTVQAADHTGGNSGKGGDILYRWGNPQAYNQGTLADKKFFSQHNAYWIGQGYPHENNIMVFNNGLNRPGIDYSSVEILSPPVDTLGNYQPALPFGPDSTFWKYSDPVPANFYSSNISGAQQLINGNVLICEGRTGRFFEIDSNKNTVWTYMNPEAVSGILSQGDSPANNNVFRCSFYNSDYSGFAGLTLLAGQPIELNPLPYTCTPDTITTTVHKNAFQANALYIFPNPAGNLINVVQPNGSPAPAKIEIYDLPGKRLYSRMMSDQKTQIDISGLSAGLYIIKTGNNFARFIKE